jgi:hypothetical protein
MLIRCVCLSLVLSVTVPAWPQLGVDSYKIPDTANAETQMLTPPPVSGQSYPTVVGDEARSNYLSAGLAVHTAYDNNLLVGDSSVPIGDVIYSFFPTIAISQITRRQKLIFTYSPGFTLYQHTSSLNGINQNANIDLQYRLSPHVAIILEDVVQKSSNIFEQPYPLSVGAISASLQASSTEVVAPYADHLNNVTNVGISYQFSRNSMLGVGGIVTESNYPNPAQAPGLYNSNSIGDSEFYTSRLSNTQYLGLTYQYLSSRSNPVSTQGSITSSRIDVQTQAFLPFYTIYFTPTLSLSLSAGPQHYEATQALSSSVRSWTPSVITSIGWQRNRTNFVANYSRSVTGGIGLPGAFNSNSANASGRWQIAHTWTIGANGSYAIYKNLTPLFSSSSPNGHTLSGTASVQHTIGERLKAEFEYTRLHQSYSGVQVISGAPDSNRESISLSYQFTRPLGR